MMPNDECASIASRVPGPWRDLLAEELKKPYLDELAQFVERERARHTVFPPEEDVFHAFEATPPERLKVLLLGQDPYHRPGQAHGLCFSVRPGVKPPRSLKNVFKELHDDVGCEIPNCGDLTPWAGQGVMLLNAVLTVREGEAGSHRGRGWERFTDAVIRTVSDRWEGVVFVLWGGYARKKRELIDLDRHAVIEAAHPSPQSAYNGFFGTRPFSRINRALKDRGHAEIDWCLPVDSDS